ncbi:FAD/NAD(P)-binding domain-containing protein [Trametopsis cervina]|nr:FAD/NAD(P)-binding domain-containing protein [Trametopsis cervina]
MSHQYPRTRPSGLLSSYIQKQHAGTDHLRFFARCFLDCHRSPTMSSSPPEQKPYAAPDQQASATGIAEQLNLFGGRKAALRIHFLIVGCGLGGLAAAHCLSQAGHAVTVIESASAIGEVGAGIQVTPNLSSMLIRWGLGDALKKVGVRPEAVVLRRYATGEVVGYTRWGSKIEEAHGFPYYHVHRADFHKLLFDLAAPNMTLRLKSTVVSVDPGPEQPSVTLASGEVVKGDVIIGADGVKSTVQQTVLERVNPATPTGDAVYRAIIPTDVMIKDPELKPFVDTPEMTGWMGPRRHIMAYCIRGKREYNIVLAHPDDGSVESWTAEGSADKMREDFADFEPRVRKLLSFVTSTMKWRLMDRQPLDTWVHSSGRVTLLGDACHPMLPYRAQGAATAIEDGCVLGNLFSRLSSHAQIAPLLHAYEQLRLPRTADTQASSRLNQKIFHLEDGEEQRARDQSMREAAEAERQDELRAAEKRERRSWDQMRGAGNANQWADERKNEGQFAYDADASVDAWWADVGGEQIEALGNPQLSTGQ